MVTGEIKDAVGYHEFEGYYVLDSGERFVGLWQAALINRLLHPEENMFAGRLAHRGRRGCNLVNPCVSLPLETDQQIVDTSVSLKFELRVARDLVECRVRPYEIILAIKGDFELRCLFPAERGENRTSLVGTVTRRHSPGPSRLFQQRSRL